MFANHLHIKYSVSDSPLNINKKHNYFSPPCLLSNNLIKKKLKRSLKFLANSVREAVLANADSGATGNYLTLADIRVLRDVRTSTAVEQISVAVATGTLVRSTHHGYLDVPGHGPMIAYIFPQLKGSLLSVSALVDVGLHVTYCSNYVTAFDHPGKHYFPRKQGHSHRTLDGRLDVIVFCYIRLTTYCKP